jgi:hypothetical protein
MSILPHLATEILRHICSSLPCSSALDFLLVCRSAYYACDHWTVWRDVVGNGAQYRAGITIADVNNREAWKRYVVAAAKAERGREAWSNEDISKWLPQVAALGHADIWKDAVPFLDRLCTAVLQTATTVPHFEVDIPDIAILALSTDSGTFDTHTWRLAQASAFCLSMRSLSLHSFPEVVAYSKVLRTLPRPELVELDHPTIPTQDWERHVVIQHALANRIVGCAHAQIRFALANRSATSQSTVSLSSLPTNRSIPFQQLMNLPLPFSADSIEYFSKCHVPYMLTPSFFTAEEWTGYFTAVVMPGYSIRVDGIGGPHHDGFDNPVTGSSAPPGNFPNGRHFESVVRFQLAEQRHNGLYVLQSNNFHSENMLNRLTITVSPQSGLLIVQYWVPMGTGLLTSEGVMTPFGIIAGIIPGMWMWLWKVSWCGGW